MLDRTDAGTYAGDMQNSSDGKKGKSAGSGPSDRDERLRKALRDNLSKRKAQARGRSGATSTKPKSAS